MKKTCKYSHKNMKSPLLLQYHNTPIKPVFVLLTSGNVLSD